MHALLGLAFYPEYVLRGAIVGLTYGLLALGIVLVFRSSGIINFAHGEMGIFAGQAFVIFVVRWHIPYWIAFVLALIIGAAAGALAEVVLVRRLRNAPRVMSVVATLGFGQFLAVFTSTIAGKDGSTLVFPKPTGFPTFQFRTFFVGQPFVAILVLSPVVIMAIAVFLRFSRIGIGLRAAAANPEAARMAGLSPSRMSAIAWALAGALSAYTTLLVVPALGFGATGTTNAPGLLLRALTVAVIARMTNIPVTLLAGLAVGIVESVLQLNYSNGGPIDVVLFLIAVGALLLQSGRRGRAAGRDDWTAIEPWKPLTAELRSNPLIRRTGGIVAALSLAAAVVFGLTTSNEHASTGTLILRMAVVGLSIVVLTGLAGQLSLGQFGVAAVAATAAARWTAGAGEPLSSLVVGGVVGAIVSVLLGLPALRVRGLMLTVTTLGLAIATSSWLLRQPWMLGSGIAVNEKRILGLDIATGRHYYWFVLAVFVVVFWATRNLARSGFGRRLVALRDNEDQARAFTVSAARTMLTAYAISGFIAGIGGALYVHSVGRVSVEGFPVIDSLNVTALAVLGGLGLVAGPILGALYIIGLPQLPIDSLGLAATSLGWLILLLYVPSGLAGLVAPLRAALHRFLLRSEPMSAPASLPAQPRAAPSAPSFRSIPLVRERLDRDTHSEGSSEVVLRAVNVTKRFGGLVAVNDVSLEVRRGETLGLIGPNGAGKTTLFEILGGFTRADAGVIEFEQRNVTDVGPEVRARNGLVRSFQDAPLFATMSVRSTIMLAHERFVPSHVWPSLVGAQRSERRTAATTDELIELMGLSAFAGKAVHELSTGTRRITELACLLALQPTVLLLDEPSSGIAQRETESLGDLLASIKTHLGTTIVVIEHDMPLIRTLSNRLIAMEAGAVIASGVPAAVLQHPRVVESYLGGDLAAIERSDAAPAPTR